MENDFEIDYLIIEGKIKLKLKKKANPDKN